MKTAKQIGEKVAEKVNRAKERIARKVGKKAAKTAAALLAVCLAMCGCSTTGQQPAKSQTQNNELHDCIVIVGATKLTMPQGVKIETQEKTELPELGIMTQMQSLESSGTESYAQRADPRNTTDSTRRSMSRSTRGTAARLLRRQARRRNCSARARTGCPGRSASPA